MKVRISSLAMLLGCSLSGVLLAQDEPLEAKAIGGQVTAVAPSSASLNVVTRFFVSGVALPDTLAFAIADAECAKVTSNATQGVFNCTPRAVGSKAYVVKDKPGGSSMASGSIQIGSVVATPTPQPAPMPAPQPTMNIAGATVAAPLLLNQPVTFNLTGSDLTSAQIRISLTNCDGNSIQALSSSQARFSCTPRSLGTQRLFWKRPGSETEMTLGQFTVGQPAVTQPQPTPAPIPQPAMNIASASPVAALVINQIATFNLTGTDLTNGQIRMSLSNCDGGNVQVLNASQARYSCTPRAAGSQRLFWKRPGAEVEITLGQFNVAAPTQPSPTLPIAGVLSADPHEMWRNWQSGTAAVKTQQLRDGRASTLSPAEIIYYSAQENGTNPVTIITKLQGEQGLIEGNYGGDELKNRLELATGYGARVGAKWFGFYPQVVGLSYQFDLFAKQNMPFAMAYQTYTQDIRGPFSQFQVIYAKYAAALNRIAGTNYSTSPADQGYYRDFLNVGPQAIQSLLQQMGGTLSNTKLFGGSGVVAGGVVAVPTTPSQPPVVGAAYSIQSISPLSGTVGQKVTFTVQGAIPSTMVINLDGERCYNESKPAPNQVVCDVTKVGINPILTVKDKSGGTVLRTFSFEGKAAPVASGKLAAPLAALTVTQPFGNHLGTYAGIGYNGYHTGTDFRGVRGTPVFAIADGTVTRAAIAAASGNAGALGWYVVIEHPVLNVRSVYVHTEQPNISVGASVRAGQQIASLASPSLVPSHLHLEIQRLDKKVVNSKGNFTPFVGKSTSPVGNRGYVSKQIDLNSVWLNPVQFLNGGVAVKAEVIGTQFSIQEIPVDVTNHAFSEDTQGDDPPLNEQISRQQLLDEIARFAVAKKLAQNSSAGEMLRLGIFRGTTLSRPADSASRMEAALMVQRLLEPVHLPSTNTGNRFSVEEFGNTPEASEQDYLSVVNRLFQWGVVNGQQDYLGNWRYYPTRKISRNELGLILERMNTVVPSAASSNIPVANNPNSPIDNNIGNPQTQFPGQPTLIPVGISVSNPNPKVGETVYVNLTGNLPGGQNSDIYLYIKVAQLGGQVAWYYDRKLNDDAARPWRLSVAGPNLPEANPIFQYTPRIEGEYSVGVLVLAAGSQVNFSKAVELNFVVKN